MESKYSRCLFDKISILIYTFIGERMNKEFSNIIVFNSQGIEFVVEKLDKMLTDLNYTRCDSKQSSIKIDVIQDDINNICIISSEYFKFENLHENKSIIRKIAKRVAQDTFMVTSKEDIAVLEKYSFNKRIYDYICLGNEEKLSSLGYNESYANYMQPIVWSNHFVGRNTLENLNNILKEKNTYFNYYEVLVEILKLYGIKYELSTYKSNDTIQNHEIQKLELYYKI